jgi:hypothetical protein
MQKTLLSESNDGKIQNKRHNISIVVNKGAQGGNFPSSSTPFLSSLPKFQQIKRAMHGKVVFRSSTSSSPV